VTELHITASDTVVYCHALLSIVDSSIRLTMGSAQGERQLADRARAPLFIHQREGSYDFS
jgi:hypothetical protein